MKQSELRQQERAIDDALAFATRLSDGAPERAMLARYICVLASGLLENIVRTRLAEFASQSRPRVELQDFVEASIERFQNPDFDKILEIVGRFSVSWRIKINELDDSIKTAITSIVANRHLIAHGRQSSISLAQINEYVLRAKEFMKEFNQICR